MENEKYNLEKALEEASALRQKIDSGAASDYGEAEVQLSKEVETESNPEKSIVNLWKEIIDNCQEASPRMNQELKRIFPESGPYVKNLYAAQPDEGFDQNKAQEEVAEKLQHTNLPDKVYAGTKLDQGETLYCIASLLNNSALAAENIETSIRETLEGKRILIIGDDFGTLSETLNAFGAEATGIDYSKSNVTAAHSGVFAEGGKPQTQVLEANAWDIADSDSDLYKQLRECGPFDMVYAYAVFNYGSGFTESEPEGGPRKFNLSIEQLLSNEGIQFYPHSDGDILLNNVFKLDGNSIDYYREEIIKLNKPELREVIDTLIQEYSQNYAYPIGDDKTPFSVESSVIIRGNLATRILPLVDKLRKTLGIMQRRYL